MIFSNSYVVFIFLMNFITYKFVLREKFVSGVIIDV